MPRLAGSVAASSLALALAAPAPNASAAEPRPGVFAGSLGVTVPAKARATVRAVDRRTGIVAAAARIGRRGSFRLSVPPGPYAVAATIVPPSGRVVERPVVGVSLKAGQRRTKASLKNARRKAKPRKRPPRARAAFVQERGDVTPGRIAVVVPHFKSPSNVGEDKFLGPAMGELLLTDLIRLGAADGPCRFAVREFERIDEVIRELEFQQSRYVDPRTRVTRNFIVPDVEVRGAIEAAGPDRYRYVVRLVNARTAAELSRVTGEFAGDDAFSHAADVLAPRITDELCKLSDVYEVKLDAVGTATFATHDSRGELHATLRARRRAGDGGGEVWRDRGTLVWEGVSFTSKTDCSYIGVVPGALPWSVTILDAGNGLLQVVWDAESAGVAGNSSATAECPGDPGPVLIPGQPGVSLIGVMPAPFTVPYAGGTHPLTGELTQGADGWRTTGTITVRPAGLAGPEPPG